MPSLFDPYDLGPVRLKNRIVMAPMERSRARNIGWVPGAETALYFAQRASAGLIVTGSIAISEWARTWAFEPGLYTAAQVEGWRRVTRAVHDNGGVIFGQLRHGGRASHVSHQPNGQAPVSSTETGATRAISMAFDADGRPAFLVQSKPRALRTGEVSRIASAFGAAARNAREGGLDGVEIHAANGYLHDQFINGAQSSEAWTEIARLFARLALGASFLSAVSDRFGLWGPYGAKNVAWGDFSHFVEYTRAVTALLPGSLAESLAWAATVAETLFGVWLIVGLKVRVTAVLSGVLLLSFAMGMATGLGVKTPFDYSVFSAAGAAFLLAFSGPDRFTLTNLLRRARNKRVQDRVPWSPLAVGLPRRNRVASWSEAMAEMTAMEFTAELKLQPVRRPVPEPQAGGILIQVSAAGVTPTEKLWYTTSHRADGTARSRATPGHEITGIVAGLGAGATGFSPGDAVFGFNDWFAAGATAEFCVTKPSNLAPKPASFSHVEAASVPIGLLTAWQGLRSRAQSRNGERILIHVGAGAVGLFAVQLAKSRGAYVIATSSKVNINFVTRLGADEVIDHRERRFEEAGLVDVVFGTVGGETMDRSWDLLKPGDRLGTIAADAESSADSRVKSASLSSRTANNWRH